MPGVLFKEFDHRLSIVYFKEFYQDKKKMRTFRPERKPNYQSKKWLRHGSHKVSESSEELDSGQSVFLMGSKSSAKRTKSSFK